MEKLVVKGFLMLTGAGLIIFVYLLIARTLRKEEGKISLVVQDKSFNPEKRDELFDRIELFVRQSKIVMMSKIILGFFLVLFGIAGSSSLLNHLSSCTFLQIVELKKGGFFIISPIMLISGLILISGNIRMFSTFSHALTREKE